MNTYFLAKILATEANIFLASVQHMNSYRSHVHIFSIYTMGIDHYI